MPLIQPPTKNQTRHWNPTSVKDPVQDIDITDELKKSLAAEMRTGK